MIKIPNPLSLQPDYSMFLPATEEEKQSLNIMRESIGFWRDGARRLKKNKLAMFSLLVIIVVIILAFIVPSFYPYDYKTLINGSENLALMAYSAQEQALKDSGVSVFPHFLGTDSLGRDLTARTMMGSRISLLVGLIASVLIMLIGSTLRLHRGLFRRTHRPDHDAYRRPDLYGSGSHYHYSAFLHFEVSSQGSG